MLDFLDLKFFTNIYVLVFFVIMFIMSSLLYINSLLREKKNYMQRQRAKQLEEQTRKDFISNINHEIRTPVNVISGMLHLLFRQDLDEQTKTYVEKIKLANNDITNVIDTALDFNKLSTDGIVTNNKEMNFDNFIKNLKDDFSFTARQKGIKLSFVIDEHIPRTLVTDEYLLKGVCQKLLSNAIKFTDTGEVDFKVDLTNSNDSIVNLHFQVRDTGIGMDKETVKSIFKAFKQGDGSKTRTHGGIGVGLFISEKMLESLKSEIKIETELGKGSKFSFSIITDYLTNDLSDAEICEGKKIMFVDDDVINREIGQSLLSKLKVDAQVLSSGQEVLDNINSTIDLVLLDIKMPNMNGTEVAKKLREMGYKDLPILALTGSADEEDLEEYRKTGMLACIAKPIDFEVLKTSIADVLRARSGSTTFKKISKEDSLNSSDAQTFDANKGLRLINKDEVLFCEILAKFRNSFEDSAEKLNHLVDAEDFPAATILAHSIKGISANIGAVPLSNMAKDLEKDLKVNKKIDTGDFECELKKVIIEIEKHLSSKNQIVESKDKKKGSIDDLKKLLDELQTAVLRNDPIKSKKIIEEISSYSFSDTISESLTGLINAVSIYDFSEANKIIEEMNKSLKE